MEVVNKQEERKQGERTKIMGILNVTPDSYFAPSRAMQPVAAMHRAEQLITEGADYIDIGACSTRPGSMEVDAETEWNRLRAVLPDLRRLIPSEIKISIDTFRWEIIERCLDLIGEVVVNDISAGDDDVQMLPNVGRNALEYIAMHKRGIASTMQSMCQYCDITAEIMAYFRDFEQKSMVYGIDNWILDPGFGFAKTAQQGRELLDRLSEFKVFNRPILVGISRKSMIYNPLGLTKDEIAALSPEEASKISPDTDEVLELTQKMHQKAVLSGASILRVHDVKAAIDALML